MLIRVLLIEDSEDDAGFTLRLLNEGGYQTESVRIETADALRAALREPAWDLIISNYELPQFNAPAALEILQGSGLDTPLIILSEAVGEEAAVASMLAGAHDFILKGRLTRLIPAVERALREAQERQNYQKIRENLIRAEERFVKAFQLSPNAISITSLTDGTCIDVNESFLDLLGYSREEVVGQAIHELDIWANPEVRTQISELLGVRDWEVQLRRRSGELRDARISSEIIMLDDEPCLLTVIHDTTERKRAAETRRRNEEISRLLIQGVKDYAIYLLDAEGRVATWNPGIERLKGYGEEILGQHFEVFFTPEDRASGKPLRLLWAAESLGYAEDQGWRLRKNGTRFWADASLTALRNGDGSLYGFTKITRDLTERRQAEQKLQEYNQRLMTLHAIDQAILTSQSDQVINQIVLEHLSLQLFFPGSSIVVFGFSGRTGLISTMVQNQLVHTHLPTTALQPEWPQEDAWAFNTEPFQIITDPPPPIQRPGIQALYEQGFRHFLHIPLFAQEELVGTLNLATDDHDAPTAKIMEIVLEVAAQLAIAVQQSRFREQISQHTTDLEQRVAVRTEELTRTKERVEAILNNSSDTILFLNTDAVIQEANLAFQGMFGYPKQAILGQPLPVLVEPNDADTLLETLTMAASASGVVRLDLVGRRKAGDYFDMDIALAPVRIEGTFSGHVCSIRDITERKQAERGLHQALDKERELNDLKTRFTAIVSHEFRTPLSVILSSMNILDRYGLHLTEEHRREHFDRIRMQIDQLVNLLDNILTLGRADAIDLERNAETLDLPAFCAKIVDDIKLTTAIHQIEFLQTGTVRPVRIDTAIMRRALNNLLSNAVKYSPAGGQVKLELIYADDRLLVRCSDQGIGIPPADQARLFEGFHRASNVGNISGTGLGLPIVKRAVEAHRGDIFIDSEVDVGTTITLTLPYPD